MGVIPQRTFERHLQQCSEDEFRKFVARLWDASDWETTVEDDVVGAMNDSRRERLLIVPPSRLSQLPLAPSVLNALPSWLSPAGPRSDDDKAVDRVVVPYDTEKRALPRRVPDVPVVDATSLRHRLLYGIDDETAEELCLDVLGVPLREQRWDDASEQGTLVERLTSEESASALASRRTLLGLLGIGALGAVAFVLQERTGEDSEAPPLNDPPPTPETAPDARFEFDLVGEFLHITYVGGETVETDQIAVEGSGFVGAPRFVWSDSLQFEAESTVEVGDTLELTVRDGLDVEVVWNDGETLATFEETAPESLDVETVPDVSFEFTFTNGLLTVEYTGEDTIRANHVLFRGTGFGAGGEMGWNDATVVGQTHLERTDFITFETDPAVTISAYWSTPSREVLVDQFTGPDRPLDPSGGSVPTFGTDLANTAYLPDGTGPTSDVTAQWSFETSDDIQSSPVLTEGTVYVGDSDTTLYALDGVDGAELWRFEMEAGIVGPSAPAVAEISGPETAQHGPVFVGDPHRLLFVGDAGGTVYALDAKTGDSLWQRNLLDGVTAAVVVTKTGNVPVVLVTGTDENRPTVVALDGRDGTERWRADEDPGFGQNPFSTPAVDDGTVYTGSLGGVVTALDLETGSERWRRPREEGHRREAFLAVSDRTVFATTVRGEVFAFDREDGTEQWTAERVNQILSPPALVHDDGSGLVISDLSGRVVALDRSDGEVQWEFDAGSSVPAIAGTGNDGAPALYFGTTDGEVFGLDATSGTELWQFQPEALTLPTVRSSPVVVDNVVYVSYEQGIVYALTDEES